jgi:predicted DNA-binding transcriptional regulator AlpA
MTVPKKLMAERLKLNEVLEHLRISKSAWYDGVRRQVFPQPLRIGTRTVVWLESEIEDYLQKKHGGTNRTAA